MEITKTLIYMWKIRKNFNLSLKKYTKFKFINKKSNKASINIDIFYKICYIDRYSRTGGKFLVRSGIPDERMEELGSVSKKILRKVLR
jgi:hypothetical protein